MISRLTKYFIVKYLFRNKLIVLPHPFVRFLDSEDYATNLWKNCPGVGTFHAVFISISVKVFTIFYGLYASQMFMLYAAESVACNFCHDSRIQ